MRTIDTVRGHWAIMPDKLIECQELSKPYLMDADTSPDALGKKSGQRINGGMPDEIVDGVSLIRVDGPTFKRLSFYQQLVGGVALQEKSAELARATVNPEVHSVVLYIDSPGGVVDGVQAFASQVFKARSSGKNIVAFSDGLMASAAYWIGAQAHQSFISGDTVTVGSIGVVARHIDISKMEEKIGFKTTEITAGKYKRVNSMYEPLSDTGRRTIQEQLDHIYGAFLADVVKARPQLSIEPVVRGTEETIPWADGRLFFGNQAVKVGLVDGITSLPLLLSRLSKEKGQFLTGTSHKPAITSKSPDVDESKLPLEVRAKRQWDRSPDLRDEFKMGGYQSWLNWCKHEKSVRIVSHNESK